MKKLKTLLFIRATHDAVGVIDGRWFEQMRALVLAVCSCGQRARPFNRKQNSSRFKTIVFVIDHKEFYFGQNMILCFQFLMVYKQTKDKMHGTETSINQL